MKEFFWTYFHKTGNVDAYMLYKEAGSDIEQEEEHMEEQMSGMQVESLE